MAGDEEPKAIPDYREIFKLAEEYTAASLVLDKYAASHEQRWSAPRLLIDSFAVELYLKCLYVLDKNSAPPTVHDWKFLFGSLEPHTQRAIRVRFNSIVNADVVLAHLHEINPEAVKLIDFDRSLDAARDTFDKRRYGYELQPDGEWFYAHLLRASVRDVSRMDIRLAALSGQSSAAEYGIS